MFRELILTTLIDLASYCRLLPIDVPKADAESVRTLAETHWHFYKFTREATEGRLRTYNSG